MNIIILVFIIVEIIIITFEIWKTRKACKATIAKAYWRMNLNVSIGIVWALLFSVFAYFFLVSLRDVLYLYDGEYIKNIFQLFDYSYLKDLENYFTEKQMFSRAIDIIFYRSTSFRSVTWLTISSTNSFVFLFRGFQRQRICGDLLMTPKGNYKWDNVLEYSWSEEINTRKLDYYSLYIKLRRSKHEAKILNNDIQEVELRFNIDNKEKVEKFLSETIAKD